MAKISFAGIDYSVGAFLMQIHHVVGIDVKTGNNTETITIICESCGKRLTDIDIKLKTPQVLNCRKCWKQNIYYPNTGKTKLVDIPERKTSSGMTFV